MKKIMMLAGIFFLVISCGPTKVAKEARKTFDGNWTLTSVTYPNNTGQFNVTLFNQASASCFENSTWDFVSNNNQGEYTLQGSNCISGIQHFNWSIEEETAPAGMFDFLLKPTNEKHKSTTGNQGFRLSLKTLSETNMVWEQTVVLEGAPFTIRMNFSKL